MSELQIKSVKAAVRYLKMADYEILATNITNKINIVAIDPYNQLRFIRVKGYKRGPQSGDQTVSSKLRSKMELGMFNFINERNEYIDLPAYIDLILIYAAESMDRAFLTYVKDCVNL